MSTFLAIYLGFGLGLCAFVDADVDFDGLPNWITTAIIMAITIQFWPVFVYAALRRRG